MAMWLSPVGIVLLLGVQACSSTVTESASPTAMDMSLYPGVSEGPPAELLPGSTYTAEWERVGDMTTFGVQVCAIGGEPLAVDSIEPTGTVGTGFRVIQTRVVRFKRVDGATLAVDGPPPERSGERTIERGDPGIEPCSDGGVWATEVQVVLQATGPDGGGWQGLLLRYKEDVDRTLVVHFGMLLCGQSTSPCAH